MKLAVGPRQFLRGNGGQPGQCHAVTLAALPGGDLLAAFFAGTREGFGDTAIWLSRRHDGVWQSPLRLMAEEGLAHWNPVLHASGHRIWLFYKVGATVHVWITRVTVSDDGGATWSVPRPLVPGETAPRGPVKNKLLVLADGAWLAPASTEDDRHWDAFVDRSADEAASWNRCEVPIAHDVHRTAAADAPWRGLSEQALWESDPARTFAWDGVIQPSLWQSAPGRVHMLLRSTRGRIFRSDSDDAGLTWRPAYATTLPNNNSGLDLVRLPGGELVLACNPVAGNWASRSPLVLLVSADNGKSWAQEAVLEDADGEFSYPAVIEHDGRLLVGYTWNRTDIVVREIVHG